MSEWTVGTPVRFWTGVREGEGRTGTIKHEGVHQVGGTDCVYVRSDDGVSIGAVALTHVELLPERNRDAKRTAGGFAKFAETATPLEQVVWKRCQAEFGHLWISTSTDVRAALVRARCALFLRRITPQEVQAILNSGGDEWLDYPDKLAAKINAFFAAGEAPLPADGFTITFDPSLTPEQVKGVLTALADYYRACGGVGFEVEVAS